MSISKSEDKLAVLADGRNAWRKMSGEQRATFLAWILEEADASGVGYGLVSIEQKIHGVPFRRSTIDGVGEQRFLISHENGNGEHWLRAAEIGEGR